VAIRHALILLLLTGAVALPRCASADGASSPPPQSSSSVVYCYDRARDIVSHVLASECRGEAVDEPFAKAVQERRDAATLHALQAQHQQGPDGLRLTRIGTAFYVDDAARLLTNNHVIEDCRSITIAEKASGETVASVLAIDAADDLALLGVKGSVHEVAHFRSDDANLADTFVATVGYPDQGMPPLQPMVTNGTLLRGAAGMADGNILFKAPVRRGNSGGPIFDSRGGVIGILRARVDEVQTYSATGRVVEDTAVGVGLGTVLDFLDQNGAKYQISQDSEVANTGQILTNAAAFVVRAECWR
jgi:serine protease Do